MKIVVIGPEETVLGFRLIGIEGVAVSGAEDTSTALHDVLTRKDTGLILITEKAAAYVREDVEARVYGGGLPLVLEIPDASGPAPNKATVEEIVRRAIGIGL